MGMITNELISRYRKEYDEDRTIRTMHAAMSKTEIADLAFIPMNAAKLNGEFEIDLSNNRKVTAQQRSGRCWMFAGMNFIRGAVAKNCNMETAEISGNYLAFWDKLEKANNILETIIAHANEPAGSRINEYITSGLGDGGDWAMFVKLVKKYGCVPANVMPDTYTSCHTEKYRLLVSNLLRKDAAELRRMVRNGEDVTARKEEMLGEVYRMQCIAFGVPVETFDFTWRDKDKEYHADYNLTPKNFYEKYVGIDLDDYAFIMCQPTTLRPLNKKYRLHDSGCMVENDMEYINISNQEVEELVLKQLRDGEPVWFGCDSRHYGERSKGIWDPDCFDYEGIFGVGLKMDVTDALEMNESFSTHAMLLVGVNFDENGVPNRWKIENSWGEDAGRKGYFVCSETYFHTYVYEAIIHKKYMNEAQLALLDSEAVEIQPWTI